MGSDNVPSLEPSTAGKKGTGEGGIWLIERMKGPWLHSPLFILGGTYTVLAALWARPIPRTALEGRKIVNRVCPCVCVIGIWHVSV